MGVGVNQARQQPGAYSSWSSSRALIVGLPACDSGKRVPTSARPGTSISTESLRSSSFSCSIRKSMLTRACFLQFSQFRTVDDGRESGQRIRAQLDLPVQPDAVEIAVIEPEHRVVGGDILVPHRRAGRHVAAVMRLDREVLIAAAGLAAESSRPSREVSHPRSRERTAAHPRIASGTPGATARTDSRDACTRCGRPCSPARAK
jgi:hypothetical protein